MWKMVVGRDRIRRQPFATCVLVEVIAGIKALIDGVRIEVLQLRSLVLSVCGGTRVIANGAGYVGSLPQHHHRQDQSQCEYCNSRNRHFASWEMHNCGIEQHRSIAGTHTDRSEFHVGDEVKRHTLTSSRPTNVLQTNSPVVR